MKRTLFTATLCLVLIFASVMLLIRAQLYDDTELRAFLMPPDGCPAPCFMGIQPGITTVDEAIAILDTHDWVDEINKINYPTYLSWSWSGSQPQFINSSESGGFSAYTGTTVERIILATRIATIEFWWMYGKPHWKDFSFYENGTTNYKFGFPSQNSVISTVVVSCQNALYVLTNNSTLHIEANVSETHTPIYDIDPYDVSLKEFSSKIRCRQS